MVGPAGDVELGVGLCWWRAVKAGFWRPRTQHSQEIGLVSVANFCVFTLGQAMCYGLYVHHLL